MATSSITKQFIVKDDKACERLISVLSQPTSRKKKSNTPSKYEEGKKKLAQYLYQ